MSKENLTNEMLDFINKSHSCFHTIENLKNSLLEKGFNQLSEKENWKLNRGEKYFVIRNGSSIISFVLPENDYKGFYITASHSDSPSFKIKENPEMFSCGITKLNVEKYGGMLINPWFDRPLSFAGRVTFSANENGKVEIKQKLVDIDKNLLMIPNLAIHMNRDANEGHKIDVQNELMPLISSKKDFKLIKLLAEQCSVKEDQILSYDLFLYNRDKGTFWGNEDEFISSPKLDDLECVYTTFAAFTESSNSENVIVHCVFDNEEVGSQTRQGAGSTFLYDVLRRINFCTGRNEENYYASISRSFLISADNAHAVHPNYASVADPVNRPVVNGGVVMKFNAAQKYTSDSLSSAVFKQICKKAGVPFQIFTNNSNVAGGSTLGNISTNQVSVLSVDIGLPQWAMHSPNESAGAMDPVYMVKAIKEFYSSSISAE